MIHYDFSGLATQMGLRTLGPMGTHGDLWQPDLGAWHVGPLIATSNYYVVNGVLWGWGTLYRGPLATTLRR